jgi:hypothetical protein
MSIGVERIMRGRDRVSSVLNQYLEPTRALERANNIAQALILCADDPSHIALEMLDDLGLQNKNAIAAEVGKAWVLGIRPGRQQSLGL